MQMSGRNENASQPIFYSVSEQGKGEIRKCEGPNDLWQIRCEYVDPDWSRPWSLDFIRKYYCYEHARCVVELAAAWQRGKEHVSSAAPPAVRSPCPSIPAGRTGKPPRGRA